jgi:hypothetical protein
METVIPAAIIIGLLLLAMLTMTEQALFAQEIAAESWLEMQERQGEWNRTSLSVVEAISDGNFVTVTLENDGDTKLADFDQWDVILEYKGSDGTYYKGWYPYIEPPLGWWENDWTENIHDDAFDPGIFNPGEEMTIRISVTPTIKTGTTNKAIIATPNGVTASTVFTH